MYEHAGFYLVSVGVDGGILYPGLKYSLNHSAPFNFLPAKILPTHGDFTE